MLITIDTLRADRLGAYGYSRAATATLDSLASVGILYENAMSTSPLTLPSHSSMLTGLYPHEHASRSNGMPATESVSLVPRELGESGYATAAVVSSTVLGSRYGLARAFEIYDEDGLSADAHERDAGTSTAAALKAWRSMAGRPRFLWVHYFDPHHPYVDHAGPVDRDRYDEEISYVDSQIRVLLDGLDSSDLAIIVTSDHGEGLGEHGEEQHGLLLYQSTIHVPLIVVDPNATVANLRVSAAVSTIDVAATLREFGGLDAPAPTPSVSLLAAKPRSGRPLLSETMVPFHNHGASPLASIRLDNWKYIAAPRAELYDLSADSREAANLAGSEQALAMEQTLREQHPLEWFTGVRPDMKGRMDAQTRNMLASLGYISGDDDELTVLTDPKDVVAALARVREGDAAASRGDASTAEAAFRRALELLPADWRAVWKLGDLLVGQGRLVDAEQCYRDAARYSPQNLSISVRLATVYRLQGRPREALSEANRVLRAYPDHQQAGLEARLAREQLETDDSRR